MAIPIPAQHTTTAPPLVIHDGELQIEVGGAAAYMIRLIVEQAFFFNAPYNAGVIHFHFSGKEQTANVKSELNCFPQSG